MTTLQQILNEPDDCSSLSAEPSFTLEDILLEPDDLLEEQLFNQDDDFDAMFDEDDDQDEDENDSENDGDGEALGEGENQQQDEIQKCQAKGESQLKENQVNQVKNFKRRSQQNKESNRASQIQNQKNIPKKQICRYQRLRQMDLPIHRQIKNMTFTPLKNVTAFFENPNSTGVGTPTAITATGSKFLAVGTSLGKIILFEVGVRGQKILGTPEHKKYGQMTSIAISKDNKYLIAAQDGGLLTVWDLYYLSEVKRQAASRTKIIKLVFCSEVEFVVNDIQGNIYLYTIQKYLWVNLKSQRIFEKTNAYYYDVKAHTLHSHTQIMALCTLDYVLVLSYKPTVTPVARIARPEDLYFSKVPNIQMGRCAVFSVFSPQNSNAERHTSDVLCVSWSKSIFLYRFVEGKSQTQNLELVIRFQQDSPIYNMEFISEGVLVTLDNEETFRSYRLWVNNGGGYLLINETKNAESVNYQRFLKDKNNKYIKSYNNSVISCCFNPKQKQLFFICKNSIFRCRIHRWNDAVNQLINCDRQFMKALKLCLQLYNKRCNIFLQYVQVSEKTTKLFCEIGRLFLVEKLRQIQKLNENRVKNIDQKNSIREVEKEVEQAYECLIEYMIEIKSQNYLFQKIYRDVIKQRHYSDQYHYKFLDCLEPFITNGFLTYIPSVELFKEVTNYYLKKSRKQLVDNLIINLEIKSIFYTQAIQICDNNKLYRSLAYVCSTHGQYIPPLNKLLKQIIYAQNNKHKNALETYYMVLKDYIVKLLALSYINGNPLIEDSEVMKKNLSTWLTCKETFSFFAKNEEEIYQKDYFYFLEGIIHSLSDEKEAREFVHGILKQLIKEKHKQKQIAQLFIKISCTLDLDEEEIEMIATHSKQQNIYKHLSQYLQFVQRYTDSIERLAMRTNFLRQSKQISYFYLFLKGERNAQINYIGESRILEQEDEEYNRVLTKFILSKGSPAKIADHIQDLLKIHSSTTMIYMLQNFSLEVVNNRLMEIKDESYRYEIVRNLLMKIRKQNTGYQHREQVKKGRKQLSQSKIAYLGVTYSESQSQCSQNEIGHHRKYLGKDVMEFYIIKLSYYKGQKRVYYELTASINDYIPNIKDEASLKKIVDTLQGRGYNSSLALILEYKSSIGLAKQQQQSNYIKAYRYYEGVYKHYFFVENYNKLMRIIHCHGRFMRRIFERMLFIAQKLNNEELWIGLLKCIITPLEQRNEFEDGGMVCDGIQKVFRKKNNHPFLMQLAQILEICLINVSNNIPIAKISQFIGQHKYVFVQQFVLHSFRSTLVTYSKNAYIYILANEMIIHDQVSQFQSIYHSKIKGSPFSTRCDHCDQPFQAHHELKLYNCGHAFHNQCHSSHKNDRQKEEEQQGEEKGGEEGKDEVEMNRCRKCIIISTGGEEEKIDPQLPDFNISQQGIFVKGVKGIASIIPSMMKVIPNPIKVFATTRAQQQEVTMQQTVDLNMEQAQNQIFQYQAFQKTLVDKQAQFSQFVGEYQKYFSKYQTK